MRYAGWLDFTESDEDWAEDERRRMRQERKRRKLKRLGANTSDEYGEEDEVQAPAEFPTVTNMICFAKESNTGTDLEAPFTDAQIIYLQGVVKKELAEQGIEGARVTDYFKQLGNGKFWVSIAVWPLISEELQRANWPIRTEKVAFTPPTPPQTAVPISTPPNEPPEDEEEEEEEKPKGPKIVNVRFEDGKIVFELESVPLKVMNNMVMSSIHHQVWKRQDSSINWAIAEEEPKKTLVINNLKHFHVIYQILDDFVDASELNNFYKNRNSRNDTKDNPFPREHEVDVKQLMFEDIIANRDEHGKPINPDNMAMIWYPDEDRAKKVDENTVDNYNQMIKCVFPENEKKKGKYYVSGDEEQYRTFLKLMKRYEFKDLREWYNIYIAKADRGAFGEIEEDEDDDVFEKNLQHILRHCEFETEDGKKLYPAQEEGVAFLYNQNAGILGDETGIGKTAQLITAAALKMEKKRLHGTLIFTVNAVKEQWAEEIQKVLGEKEADKIAVFAPKAGKNKQREVLAFQPKKWTIIHYDAFSQGSNIAHIISVLKKFGFGIVIFDELHKMKSHNAKRSKNISGLIDGIPIRWGATATLAANAPIDVQNQLSSVGHFLGKIDRRRFNRDFAAMDTEQQNCNCELTDKQLKDNYVCPKCHIRPLKKVRLEATFPQCDHRFDIAHHRKCPDCHMPTAIYREGCFHNKRDWEAEGHRGFYRDRHNICQKCLTKTLGHQCPNCRGPVESVNCPICGRPSYVKRENEKLMAAERLNKWLHLTGVYIRRKKDDVKPMIPPKLIEAGAKIDHAWYNAALAKALMSKKTGKPLTDQLAILEKTRMTIAEAKAPATTERALQLVKEGKKVVIFTCFVEAARLLEEKLGAGLRSINPNYRLLTYIGTTKKLARKSVKDDFMYDPKCPVLLMSMRMGGTGLSFPNCYTDRQKTNLIETHMLINDYDWTPELSEQSEGRIYRINTIKQVTIEYMIDPDPNSFDRWLYDRVQQKRTLAGVVQKYRKDYEDDINPEKALRTVVDKKAEIDALSRQMILRATREAKKAGLTEGFRDFIITAMDIDDLYIYEEVILDGEEEE